MKLATTTGDLLYYSRTPAEAIRAFENTGFRHLDFSFWRMAWGDRPLLKDDWKKPIAEAAEEAEKIGMDFVQAHSPGLDPLSSENPEEVVLANVRAIEACGFLGIEKIVVHAGMNGAYRYPDDKAEYFAANRAFYRRLFPAMEKYGVKVLIENGSAAPGDPFFPTSGQDLAEFVDFCGHPLLGVCWDAGHGNIRHESPYEQLVAVGERLEAVHIQDNFGKADNHLAPYMGNLDLDALMQGLFDCGYVGRGGFFTFECDNILRQSRRRDERFLQKANPTPIELKQKAVSLMYEIGKHILTGYDCFEE